MTDAQGNPRFTLAPKPTAYADDEPALLEATFELQRGENCGDASLTVNMPVTFQPLDRVSIYLAGDADADPTYTGEITSEPWTVDKGEIKIRGLRDRVAKAAWHGKASKKLQLFTLYLLSMAILPPGVTYPASGIADRLALIEADTPFNLVGDSLDTITTAVEGGAWGVNGRLEVFVQAPSLTLTHRFPLGSATLTPGDLQNYANSVRFPYTTLDPDAAANILKLEGQRQAELSQSGLTTQQVADINARYDQSETEARTRTVEVWFEGQLAEQVALYGATWLVTQAPSNLSPATPSGLEANGNAAFSLRQRSSSGGSYQYSTFAKSAPIFDSSNTTPLGLQTGHDLQGLIRVLPITQTGNPGDQLLIYGPMGDARDFTVKLGTGLNRPADGSPGADYDMTDGATLTPVGPLNPTSTSTPLVFKVPATTPTFNWTTLLITAGNAATAAITKIQL